MQLSSKKDYEGFEAHLIGSQRDLETKITTLELQLLKLVNILTPQDRLDAHVPISSVLPYTVDFRGRKYLYAFSTTSVTLSLGALGTVNLVEGIWNDIGFRPGTQITAVGVSSNSPIILFVRATDYPIFQGASGASIPSSVTATPWSGNPTSTTASTDTSFTWGADGNLQVNTLYIQNKTTTPLWYAFNQTASAGSYFLGPGDFQQWQRPLSTLHLFTTGSQPINGTNTNNIVVEGGL